MARHPARILAALGCLIVLAVVIAALAAPGHNFTRVFYTEFSGSGPGPGPQWVQYNGHEGQCCPDTLWRDYNLKVSGGVLNLIIKKDPANTSNGWTAAGVSMGQSLNQIYGEWDVRMRMDAGYGTAFGILLWPKAGWPPEIDFAEESPLEGAERRDLGTTFHYGSQNLAIRHRTRLNLTKWHTIGIRWTPGRIAYLVDGVVWAKVEDSHVPNEPMHLAIQTQDGKKGSHLIEPDYRTPNPTKLQVDWVKVYSYK